MADKIATLAGLTIIEAEVAKVRPNPWNPNRMDDLTFQKEIRSIKEHGFIDPITVRETPEGLEIVDGEHRWRASQELGIAFVPATNLGPISDDRAKKLSIIYNELRGMPEPVLLAKLLKDLNEDATIEELAAELPFSLMEIDTMVKSTEEYDWGYQHKEGDDDLRDHKPKTGGDERKFQLGVIRASIPAHLSDALAFEWDRTSDALLTKAPENILTNWLTRLAASAVVPGKEDA